MARDPLRERVAAIVSVVLGERALPQDGAETGWDSLQQIEVVLAIEDEFAVTIAETDIPRLRSVDDVMAHLHGVRASF